MARRYDDEAALVEAARAGDEAAFTTLFQRWFDPCLDVARRIVHDDEAAAEVAQETFLVAWRQLSTLRDPSAFGGWVLRTSRNKALNRLDRERRSVAVDQDEHPALARLEAVDDVAAEVGATEHHDLVWAASAALGERDASLLDLHLRHGLDPAEIAEALDVTPNSAHQMLFRMRGRLAGSIRAWVLFKGGRPSCEGLRRDLAQAGATSFSAATVKVIDRHVKACQECTDRQAAVLAPEAMFAAVPMLPVAGVLRSRVAESLRTSGVPLGPDAAVPASTSNPAPSGPGAASGTTVGPTPPPAAGALGDPGALRSDGASGPGAGDAGSDADGPPPLLPSTDHDADSDGRRMRLAAVVAVGISLVLLLGAWFLLRDDGRADDVATVVDVSDTTGTSTTTTPLAAPVETVPEPVAPPSTARPTTTTAAPEPEPPSTTTTSATPLPPPPAPPVVVSFTATPTGPCPGSVFTFTFTWATTDATAVTITSPDGTPVSGGPSGTATSCATRRTAVWTLTAVGPGGTATASD